jgi:hypothetical protein
MAKTKTWQEKMNHPAVPELKPLEKGFAGFEPGAVMLIPTPRLIEAYLMTLKAGETATVIQMRESLAKEHGADFTCPLTTGIFLRTVSEASLDSEATVDTPFWRLVEPKSPLAKKLSCGPDWIAAQRAAEA